MWHVVKHIGATATRTIISQFYLGNCFMKKENILLKDIEDCEVDMQAFVLFAYTVDCNRTTIT